MGCRVCGGGAAASTRIPSRRDIGTSRCAAWRGERADALLCGFVGRLAPEKHVERLAVLSGDPRLRLVIVGDGPERRRLERLLPDAAFTGELRGPPWRERSRHWTSSSIREHETFCQTVQEAMACGLLVVAPTPAARATWSRRCGPATSSGSRTSRRSCRGSSGTCATTRCGRRSAARRCRRCGEDLGRGVRRAGRHYRWSPRRPAGTDSGVPPDLASFRPTPPGRLIGMASTGTTLRSGQVWTRIRRGRGDLRPRRPALRHHQHRAVVRQDRGGGRRPARRSISVLARWC